MRLKRDERFLFGVFIAAVILSILGLVYDVYAKTEPTPAPVTRAIVELIALTGANKADIYVVSYYETIFRGASVDCPKVAGLRNIITRGYSVLLTTQGILFSYRVDPYQTFLCHVTYAASGIH